MSKFYFVYNEENKHYAQVCENHVEQFTSGGYSQTIVTRRDMDNYLNGCEMCLLQTAPVAST